MALLEIKNLTGGIEGKEILKGLSLSVNAGEVHAIMGRTAPGNQRWRTFSPAGLAMQRRAAR